MTRRFALIGVTALVFGLGSYQVLEAFTAFNAINLVLGLVSLFVAMWLALLRLGKARQPALRRPIERAFGQAALVIAGAIAAYWLAARSEIRFDWTFEGQFELAEATEQALDRLGAPLTMTLYSDPGDPRIRNTRILLEEMARGRDVRVRSREIERYPEDEDHFGIGSSNTVVLQLGKRWERVERPTEGALFEGLSRLVQRRQMVLYFSVGAGEGDLERGDDSGYSGMRAALEVEGYEPRPLPLALLDEVPPDAAAVVVLAAQRSLPGPSLGALQRYLDRGGSVVAFIEPGQQSGLEGWLAELGVSSPDAFVIDPTSGPMHGDPAGLDPVAFGYSEHPVTHGLNRSRMTFFRRARALRLQKLDPNDRMRAVVFSSGDAWLAPAGSFDLDEPIPPRPVDAQADYQALVVTAKLNRGEVQPRLLVFGDSDFASNRYLRALYNLDLLMNGIHWVVDREPAIALRPKTGGRQLIQFPVPLQRSISALYGVGLLIPELLILAGGLIWLRQRRA